MHARRMLVSALIIALLMSGFAIGSSPAQSGGQGTRLIPSAGTTSFQTAGQGSDAVQFPEFPGGQSEAYTAAVAGPLVNRSYSVVEGNGPAVVSGKQAKSDPGLTTSFDGLNFRQQRVANGGNQFSVEPPDQSLCVGNGYVVEAVNDVLRVFDGSGNALTGVVDLNTFYGYPAAINRTTLVRGPFVTDPSCYFDLDTQRFYQIVLTLDTMASGAFAGPNHIDIAVSNSSNPTGTWTIYRLPAQDDGTQGTPNHGCSLGPCIGDYPHIGADKYGVYITTNEYSLFGPEFKAAQIYAFSKTALASDAASVAVTQLDTSGLDAGNPGFTVWPAQSPGHQYAGAQGGTEYFLSSNAAAEANGAGSSTSLLVWALSNTKSLNSASPALKLSNASLTVGRYAVPPKANQKPGDIPLGQCINDTTLPTRFGPGCWQNLLVNEPAHNEVESHLDANDTRMQQVYYANGKLWGALDTAVTIPGDGARRHRLVHRRSQRLRARRERPPEAAGLRGGGRQQRNLPGAGRERKWAGGHRLHARRQRLLSERRLCQP